MISQQQAMNIGMQNIQTYGQEVRYEVDYYPDVNYYTGQSMGTPHYLVHAYRVSDGQYVGGVDINAYNGAIGSW